MFDFDFQLADLELDELQLNDLCTGLSDELAETLRRFEAEAEERFANADFGRAQDACDWFSQAIADLLACRTEPVLQEGLLQCRELAQLADELLMSLRAAANNISSEGDTDAK